LNQALAQEEKSCAMSTVLRVNQLDAKRLDAEMSVLLKQDFADVFAFWRPGLLEHVQPELDALLQLVLWRYTLWVDLPTPGSKLQNLVHAQATSRGITPRPLLRTQKITFLLLTVVLPWLGVRLRRLMQLTADERMGSGYSRAQSLASWCQRHLEPRLVAAHAALAALNFVFFLRNGVFPTLSDRVLGIRLVHVNPTARRQVAFAYMNRVMLWNGLSEFLMTIVPVINIAQIRQSLSRRMFQKKSRSSDELGMPQSCALCSAFPVTLPMRSDCGHIFCYFCIASEQMDRPREVACPKCSSHIQSFNHAS